MCFVSSWDERAVEGLSGAVDSMTPTQTAVARLDRAADEVFLQKYKPRKLSFSQNITISNPNTTEPPLIMHPPNHVPKPNVTDLSSFQVNHLAVSKCTFSPTRFPKRQKISDNSVRVNIKLAVDLKATKGVNSIVW